MRKPAFVFSVVALVSTGPAAAQNFTGFGISAGVGTNSLQVERSNGTDATGASSATGFMVGVLFRSELMDAWRAGTNFRFQWGGAKVSLDDVNEDVVATYATTVQGSLGRTLGENNLVYGLAELATQEYSFKFDSYDNQRETLALGGVGLGYARALPGGVSVFVEGIGRAVEEIAYSFSGAPKDGETASYSQTTTSVQIGASYDF